MIVYQHDHAGIYVGPLEADPSPLEPGQHLIPARCVAAAPPADIPSGHVARWNGAAWMLIATPSARSASSDPVALLQAFLAANPEVAALIS